MSGFQLKNAITANSTDAGTVVCIDFGTALCKAAVSVRANGAESVFPLELGSLAEDPRQDYKYFCQSSLYVSSDRKVYFGHRAEEKWATQLSSGISRIESIKRWFSTDPVEHFETEPVSKEFLPAGVTLEKRYVVILLLAYVSRLVSKGLRNHNFSIYATRRFSRPVWEVNRGSWVDKTMRECLGASQIVADSIGGHWEQDGLPLDTLVPLIDQALEAEVPQSFIEKRAILEPIAAGFLAVGSSGNQRDVSIVIDVGAGTTDVAAFLSRGAIGTKRTGAAEPVGIPNSSAFAGDYLDWVLLGDVESNFGKAWQTEPRYRIEAAGRIREWKEILFKNSSLVPTFTDGRPCNSIALARFIGEKRVTALVLKIRKQLESLFPANRISEKSALDHVLTGGHALETINVIFAGGGAALPMLNSIISSPLVIDNRRVGLVRQAMTLSKQFLHSHQYAKRYPQLAVAMGGASVEYPWGEKPRHFGLGTGKQMF